MIGEKPSASLTFSLYSKGEQVWYDITTDANGEFIHKLPLFGECEVEGIWAEPTWYPLGKRID